MIKYKIYFLPILIILLSFLVVACNSTVSPAAKVHEGPVNYTEYPFSEIGKIYDIILDKNLELYFASYPKLQEDHSASLKNFIIQNFPREKFISEMVVDENLFEKVRGNPIFWKENKEVDRAFEISVNVSVDMAQIYCFNAISVYSRERVHPDFTAPLFANAKNFEEKTYIAWIKNEVDAKTFKEKTKKHHELAPGDKFFYFNSPAYTWENLFGRAGFLIVQQSSVKETIIIQMN